MGRAEGENTLIIRVRRIQLDASLLLQLPSSKKMVKSMRWFMHLPFLHQWVLSGELDYALVVGLCHFEMLVLGLLHYLTKPHTHALKD